MLCSESSFIPYWILELPRKRISLLVLHSSLRLKVMAFQHNDMEAINIMQKMHIFEINLVSIIRIENK